MLRLMLKTKKGEDENQATNSEDSPTSSPTHTQCTALQPTLSVRQSMVCFETDHLESDDHLVLLWWESERKTRQRLVLRRAEMGMERERGLIPYCTYLTLPTYLSGGYAVCRASVVASSKQAAPSASLSLLPSSPCHISEIREWIHAILLQMSQFHLYSVWNSSIYLIWLQYITWLDFSTKWKLMRRRRGSGVAFIPFPHEVHTAMYIQLCIYSRVHTSRYILRMYSASPQHQLFFCLFPCLLA